MAYGKLEGVDGIPAEMWKAIGTVGDDKFVELCCTIYIGLECGQKSS